MHPRRKPSVVLSVRKADRDSYARMNDVGPDVHDGVGSVIARNLLYDLAPFNAVRCPCHDESEAAAANGDGVVAGVAGDGDGQCGLGAPIERSARA